MGNDTPAEVARLSALLERDRTLLARCLQEHRKVVSGYSWIREGRGPYEWDDDEYREEFGRAIRAVEAALEPLAAVASDFDGCPRSDIEVQSARRQMPEPGWVDEAMAERVADALAPVFPRFRRFQVKEVARIAMRAARNEQTPNG